MKDSTKERKDPFFSVLMKCTVSHLFHRSLSYNHTEQHRSIIVTFSLMSLATDFVSVPDTVSRLLFYSLRTAFSDVVLSSFLNQGVIKCDIFSVLHSLHRIAPIV